jgi:hypothetical protein
VGPVLREAAAPGAGAAASTIWPPMHVGMHVGLQGAYDTVVCGCWGDPAPAGDSLQSMAAAPGCGMSGFGHAQMVAIICYS